MLITKDAELMKKMNAVRSPYTRAEWYTALRLHPTRDNITSVTDEAVHSDIRTRMAPGVCRTTNRSIGRFTDVACVSTRAKKISMSKRMLTISYLHSSI